ncbi:Cytosolic phospholipase A2 gamma [Collichthys lucidus]|uniref:Cytosolic phospholipase A2 gamma n=1 Tax=Collichthys lucidus TaxID=240159 RepID=A0A4U5VUT7_COLLU|nr:Cytosolic phospholipase A2 gamma [Collichthys lucidus]
MEKEGLLDTLVYVGGISGSTWCMSSVYNDPEWSSNMDRAMSRLFRPGKWFELSPHEAGFTELGFFIETSLLGSKFKDRELVEKKPEMDMVKLEGILGSALASGEVIKEYILNWLKELFHLGGVNEGQQSVLAVLDEVIAVTRNHTKIPPVVFDLGPLQGTPEVTKANRTLNLWVKASPEERNRLAKEWSLEMLAAVETWTQSQQKGGFRDMG